MMDIMISTVYQQAEPQTFRLSPGRCYRYTRRAADGPRFRLKVASSNPCLVMGWPLILLRILAKCRLGVFRAR